MSKFYCIFLLTCIGVFAVSATGQKVLDKPIDKWSQRDAMDILSSSPWAKTYQSNEGAAVAAQQGAARDQADNRLSGAERSRTGRFMGYSPVIFRLHSGLPIRLALIRLNQIGAGYDKMNEKARAEFDASARGLLECGICQNYYVVTLTKMPNSSGQEVEEAIFEGMKLDQLKGNVTLRNDKGESRELVQFVAPQKRGDSAVLFFAKKDDKGNLLFTKDNKNIGLVFEGSFLTPSNRHAYLLPPRMDFEVSKITVGDTVVF